MKSQNLRINICYNRSYYSRQGMWLLAQFIWDLVVFFNPLAMVNYGQKLASSQISEWQDKYMDYEGLKYIIEQFCATDQVAFEQLDENQKYIFKICFEDIDAYFWDQMIESMKNVDEFYCEQLQKHRKLIDDIDTSLKSQLSSKKKDKLMRAIQDLKLNIQEVYKTITMLGSYGIMNQTGYRKLVKKRNKITTGILENRQLEYQELLTKFSFPNEQLTVQQQARLENAWVQIESQYNHKVMNARDARHALMTYCSTKVNLEQARIQKTSINSFLFGFVIMLMYQLFTIQHNVVQMGAVNLLEEYRLIMLFVRLQFVIAYHLLLIGMDIFCCEKCRLNYIFILELPPAQVISSYRTYFINWFINFIIMGLFWVLTICRIVLDEEKAGKIVTKLSAGFSYKAWFYVSSLCPKEVWLIAPTAIIFIAGIVKLIIARKRSQSYTIYGIVWNNLAKQLQPWKYRVTFPIFFVGDQLTSITQLFVDFSILISAGYAPDYVQVIFYNIPAIIRIIQCIKRYHEKFEAYPHLVNMFKYISSVPGSLLLLNFSKQNLHFQRTIVAFKCIEMIYKSYWDIAEDWALFTGGTGVKQFQSQSGKWQNKILCKRPSFFKNTVLVICFINNIIGRWLFLVPYLTSSILQDFRYQTWAITIEVTRRCIWNILRIDNQQATNCEGYSLTRYIPVLLRSEDRQYIYQKEKADKNEEETTSEAKPVSSEKTISNADGSKDLF